MKIGISMFPTDTSAAPSEVAAAAAAAAAAEFDCAGFPFYNICKPDNKEHKDHNNIMPAE